MGYKRFLCQCIVYIQSCCDDVFLVSVWYNKYRLFTHTLSLETQQTQSLSLSLSYFLLTHSIPSTNTISPITIVIKLYVLSVCLIEISPGLKCSWVWFCVEHRKITKKNNKTINNTESVIWSALRSNDSTKPFVHHRKHTHTLTHTHIQISHSLAVHWHT